MSKLNDQVNSFKKSLNANTMIGAKRVASGTMRQSSTGSSSGGSGAAKPHSTGQRRSYDYMKRKKKNTTYSQPANTGTGKHAMSQLYTVMQFLKDADGPQSVVSITSRTKVNIDTNKALWDKLIANDKVDYDPVMQTFAYKPTYQIKSKEELLNLLVSMKQLGGMDYKDLKESYMKISDAVEELAADGDILVVRNKDGQPRGLFHNDPKYNTHMDSEFRAMWSEIRIPDETDLPKQLESAGLKTMEVFEKKVVADPQPKRSKTRNKKIKITNTHLSHIDLSKDYVPKK
ncbi:hypothetical protein BC940DRAFT_287660 [Gongronella butleri]|nr:hypothetical protein BC940DRAFT_287660 [Gongronella butleri]